MAGTAQFTIGTGVSCSNGAVGRVSRVIVDPLAQKVTHLVVEPEHRRDLGRLVPLDLVDGTAGEIRLHCTKAEFEQLEHALETRFVPATSGYAGYGYSAGEVSYWSHHGRGVGGVADQRPLTPQRRVVRNCDLSDRPGALAAASEVSEYHRLLRYAGEIRPARRRSLVEPLALEGSEQERALGLGAALILDRPGHR
jgi:hypothetical protein